MTAAAIPPTPPCEYVGPDTAQTALEFQNAVLHMAHREPDCRCDICVLMGYPS